MSILFSTYQPIRRKVFAYVGAIDNLNSAFSHARFSGIYLYIYVLKKDICFKLYPSLPR